MRIDLTEKFDHRFKPYTLDGETEIFEVELGYETVVLDKCYGPLIFMDLRIHADPATCEWVIERLCGYKQLSKAAGDPYDGDGEAIWKEWARIPGQMEGDFHG